MSDEQQSLPAVATAQQFQSEIVTLEQEILALEQEYTVRLKAMGRLPTKNRQMLLSLAIFLVGSLLFMSRNTWPGLLLLLVAIGLAYDGFRHRKALDAEKMAVYSEGEALWNEKKALLAEKREELARLA